MTNLGWTRVEVHPGLRFHKRTGAMMVFYVDDLLLAARKNDEARFWKEIEHRVKFESGVPLFRRFLVVITK